MYNLFSSFYTFRQSLSQSATSLSSCSIKRALDVSLPRFSIENNNICSLTHRI